MITIIRNDRSKTGAGERLYIIQPLTWLKSLAEKKGGKAHNNLDSYKVDGPKSSDSPFYHNLEPVKREDEWHRLHQKKNIMLFCKFYIYIHTHRHTCTHTWKCNMCINVTGKTFFILTY